MDEFFEDDVDQYLQQPDDIPEGIRRASFSLVKSNDNMQTYKTKINSEANKNSVKSKYLDKLKEYSYNCDYLSGSKVEENCSLASLDKRERNRMAAKQSRDRKKLYIELMEHEQRKL